MMPDLELKEWCEQWQAEARVPADLRRKVARGTLYMRLMLASEVLVTLTIGGGSILWAVQEPRAEILGLLRRRDRPRRRAASARPAAELSGPFAVSDRCRPALRLSAGHDTRSQTSPFGVETPRSRCIATPRCRLFSLGSPHRIQPGGHFSPLPRARHAIEMRADAMAR